MGQMSKAAAGWLGHERRMSRQPEPPKTTIMNGVKIHVAFEARVETGGSKRNPTSAELEIWKTILQRTAADHFGKAHVNNAKRYKASDGNPATRVVSFTIPQKHKEAFKTTVTGANFQVGAKASVKGFQVLGQAQPPINNKKLLEIKPLI